MPLYGNELDRQLTPYDAGLGRVVKLDKASDFVGRAALAASRRPSRAEQPVLIGLAGLTRRVPRHGYPGAVGRRSGRHGNQRRALPHARQADRDGVPAR